MPFFKCSDNCQKFLLVNGVVQFCTLKVVDLNATGHTVFQEGPNNKRVPELYTPPPSLRGLCTDSVQSPSSVLAVLAQF